MYKIRKIGITLALLLISVVFTNLLNAKTYAVTNPQSGSLGIEGLVPSTPPTRAPTISTPANGQSFTSTPITINGLCETNLLVKIFSNNVFVGSTVCQNGSYSLQIDLFSGTNSLFAEEFDTLDQSSPSSNVVDVTFNPPSSITSTNILILTSAYAEKGADPGSVLTWPITLSGGNGPYAISVDWGDGTPNELLSEQYAGNFNITHTYSSAGTYVVTVKSTDKNGQLAFLELVGVANGATTSNPASSSGNTKIIKVIEVIWIPAAITLLLLPIAFWLGRKYELLSLKKHLEKL